MNAVYMQLKENKLFPPVVYCTLYIVECTIGTCIHNYIYGCLDCSCGRYTASTLLQDENE